MLPAGRLTQSWTRAMRRSSSTWHQVGPAKALQGQRVMSESCGVITGAFTEWLGSWDKTACPEAAPSISHACMQLWGPRYSVVPGIVMLKSSLRQWPLSWDVVRAPQPTPTTRPLSLAVGASDVDRAVS